jgi:hypothetical protein
MATSFTNAKTLLAPYVDNGVDPANERVAQRINEAQRRLIAHYNFLSRREEFEKDPLVYVENGKSGNLILDNLDATKVLILALWREENNELEMANLLEMKAFSYIERDLVQAVEYSRREAYQKLEAAYVITKRDGLVGRLGLETLARYRLSPERMRSYVFQAYRTAIDHYNFVIRRESLDKPFIVSNDLAGATADLEVSPEIVRELVLHQLNQDKQ